MSSIKVRSVWSIFFIIKNYPYPPSCQKVGQLIQQFQDKFILAISSSSQHCKTSNLGLQYFTITKQRMDPHQHDNASQQTLPSEHADLVSNLSTRPNFSEQNDPGFEDGPNQQRPHDNQANAEHNFPVYSERVVNHRSHSFDQGSNPLPAHYSAPPHLNQPRLQQQERENIPVLNNASSEKVFHLTTFDQDWQRNLKEEEEIREKDYENHVLLNEDNQPLLSQRHQFDHHDIIDTDNQPLLSQKSASDHSDLPIHDDPLSQNSQHALASIHQSSSQQAKSQAAVSNELKFAKFSPFKEEIMQELSQKRSQNSSFYEIPQEPLFEIGFKDESQSNLLKFGFTVKKKDNGSSSNLNGNIFESNDMSNEVITKQEQPMQIQQINFYPEVQQRNASTNHPHSEEEKILITVNDCNSENINSATKNNDIYGIHPQCNKENHQAQQEEKEFQKVQQNQEQNYNENIKFNDVSNTGQNYSNLDKLQQQCKAEPEQHIPQDKNEKQYQDQVLPAHASPIKEAPLTLQQITQQMQQIANGDDLTGIERTQKGVKLLKQHIDFLFITPRTEIGQQIMADGKTAVNLIKIILLKQSENALKDLLQKYLILTLASKVSRNQQDLADYQAASTHRVHPILVEDEAKEKHEEASRFLNSTMDQPVNQSIQAQNGSSAKKSPNQKMDIDNVQKQPVKRTVKNKNLAVNHEQPSPRSGKVTRKTRAKSKGKGKTTSKKNTVKFQEESNQSQIVVIEPPKSENKGQGRKPTKSAEKRINSKKKTDSTKKQDFDENLGSKFTYVFRENNKSHQKQLVQRRVSQRLVGRTSASKQKPQLVNNKSSERRASLRNSHSSKKKYEEEELDIDYIKKHLRSITIKTSMLEKKYNALTPEDEEIAKLLKLYDDIQEEEQSERSNQQPVEDYNHSEPEEVTTSMRSQTNSMLRREEFKKNLSKYKVGDIPIIIMRIVDPDINNHGIYALLELGKLSQEVYNARFALTPITNLSRASKRLIDEDLLEAKRQVGDFEKNNLVYMQPTSTTLDLIKEEKERRQIRL